MIVQRDVSFKPVKIDVLKPDFLKLISLSDL